MCGDCRPAFCELEKETPALRAGCQNRSVREEHLLPLQVHPGADDIARAERRPVVVPLPIGMELLAVVPVVSIAVWLPPGMEATCVLN